MLKFFAACLAMVSLSACTSETRELKSPCVGAEGSPCDKRDANTWIKKS